jgi:hypothetical protein
MKLNTDFKDYYDSMAGLDTEVDDLIFNRFYKVIENHPSIINLKSNYSVRNYLSYGKGLITFNHYSISNYHDKKWVWELKSCELLFVGQLHVPIYTFKDKQKTSICLGKEAAVEYIKDRTVKKSACRIPFGFLDSVEEDMDTIAASVKYDLGPIYLIISNARYGSSVLNPHHAVINPCLKDLNIQKLWSQNLVWGEIYKTLCQKSSDPIVPEMPNDIKIEQHGFNLKTSFRKPKAL